MQFTASYDRLTRLLTSVLSLAILGLAVAAHAFSLATIGLIAILGAYAYSPRGYRIEGRSLVIQRLASRVHLTLDDVREVRRVTADDLRGCIRIFGSAGFFGYYGLF